MLRLTILVICYTVLIEADQCSEKPYTIKVKLENDLLSAYPNVYEPPLKNATDVIEVSVELHPDYFELDVHEEYFHLHAWLFLYWTDPHLSWNPANYGGIEDITIATYKVWDPMGIIEDYSVDHSSTSSISTNSINSLGEVTFRTKFTEIVKCEVNVKRWPYDTQICTYIFGESITEQKHVRFYLSTPSQASFVQPGPGWKLNSVQITELDVVHPCGNNEETVFHTIKFVFEIRREAAGIAAIIVIPCLTLVTLSLVSQLLDLNEHPRFVLLLVSIYGHF
ncbi:Neuronal acetylcholine receptor subunit alpha-10 [Eumeta japonica]|uniref:Neuronal acetylcholine receptor subunit alpha-10 n=1 Tax=Eumeta variegata TaxID=151549 RepID=A0A4C1UQJ3_EUMVA|nr:Neuronal acetylcholine receptor subunit alpha-10 [Eumeta japonica]